MNSPCAFYNRRQNSTSLYISGICILVLYSRKQNIWVVVVEVSVSWQLLPRRFDENGLFSMPKSFDCVKDVTACVQSGLYRCGYSWACWWLELLPPSCCFSSSHGGGVPGHPLSSGEGQLRLGPRNPAFHSSRAMLRIPNIKTSVRIRHGTMRGSLRTY